MLLDTILSSLNVGTVCILAVCLLLHFLLMRRPSDIPPGPPVWIPMVGNILQLSGKDRRISFRDLRRKYGDVFSVYMGNTLVVVINGFSALSEAFVKMADVFSERPHSYVSLINKQRGIIFASGAHWKEHRKFTMGVLRKFGMGKSILDSKIQEEASHFLQSIENENGANFDMKHLTNTSVSNIICSLVFGHRYEYHDPDFIRMNELFENALRSSFGILNVFPILRYIPGDPFQSHKVGEIISNINAYIKTIYDRHVADFDPNDIRDVMDAYIDETRRQQAMDVNTTFTDDQAFSVFSELFLAGTETTATTILWAVIYIAQCQDVQDRVRAELNEVVGSSRPVSTKDRPNLPYTSAFIAEVQRLCNLSPFAIPHGVLHDVMFRGFRIPKGCTVICNLDSVLADPSVFKDPEVFDPSRFLDKTGQFLQREEAIPFGLGRRMCLGQTMARTELFLFLTAMIQRFKFLPPKGEPPLTREGILATTFSPKPFKIRAVKIS